MVHPDRKHLFTQIDTKSTEARATPLLVDEVFTGVLDHSN